MKKYLIILAIFVVSSGALFANEAEKYAEKLLEVTHFNQMIEEGKAIMIQQMLESDPLLKKNEKVFIRFFDKYLSAENFREDIIRLYAAEFTIQELKEMIAFQQTPTGQKMVQKYPKILRHCTQLGERCVMEHLGELEKMINQENKNQ